MWGEDNQDRIKVAAATDEAFWTSQFPLHHPKHLEAGLEPHSAFERWYFGRTVSKVTDVIDIGPMLERKVAAALCHQTMLRNYANQLRLHAGTGDWSIDMLDQIAGGGDLRPLMDMLIRGGARDIVQRHSLEAAEEFRIVRFGGLEGMLARHGRRPSTGQVRPQLTAGTGGLMPSSRRPHPAAAGLWPRIRACHAELFGA